MTEAGRSGCTAPKGVGDLRQSIEFRDLAVVREGRTALDGVTLRLEEGRIGIVGLNGSGKSTLLKTIVGLVRPTAGAVGVDGVDPTVDPRSVRAATGLLFQKIGRAHV